MASRQDHALVVVTVRHHRAVDAAPAHQHKVTGGQLIALTLHGVAGPARQQQDDLMKGVVVVFDVAGVVVGQIKQPERLVQIAPLFIL